MLNKKLEEALSRQKPFKYPGDKSWLVKDYLWDIWQKHEHRRWFDPFCGSLRAPQLLGCKNVFAADLNSAIVYAHMWMQLGAPHLINYEHSSVSYLALRDSYNALSEQLEYYDWLGNAVWILLNAGYCGMWRVNSHGKFNVPFGDRSSLPEIDWAYYQELMKDWGIYHLGYKSAFGFLEPDDFLFLDTPYIRTFTAYTAEKFLWLDFISVLEMTKDHPGPCVVCNSNYPEVQEAYKKFNFEFFVVDSDQRIQKPKKKSGKVSELIGFRNI